MNLKKYIASLLKMVRELDTVYANSGVIQCSHLIKSGKMINCILVACHFMSDRGGSPLLNLVHINGASKSMWESFDLKTHPFDFQPMICQRFVFSQLFADIPGYTCSHIDIIGGNDFTDESLHAEIVDLVHHYRPKIAPTIIQVLNNAPFIATITPNRKPHIQQIL